MAKDTITVDVSVNKEVLREIQVNRAGVIAALVFSIIAMWAALS